jgi:hypothetical protein
VPWQDWVLSVGGFAILISLLPTIRGDQKPALTTSFMSSVIVALFAFSMATLGLWLSAVANAGIAIAWGVLAWQRYTLNRHEQQAGLLTQIGDDVEVALGTDDEVEGPSAVSTSGRGGA